MHTGGAEPMLIALQRNRLPPARGVARLRLANLEIDALHPTIAQGTREVRLSPNEHVLLYTLAARSGTVVSYRDLADALGTGRDLPTNALARHVSSLRRKLRDDGHRFRYIETVQGIGYRFIAP